jgi:hypothetical protein
MVDQQASGTKGRGQRAKTSISWRREAVREVINLVSELAILGQQSIKRELITVIMAKPLLK